MTTAEQILSSDDLIAKLGRRADAQRELSTQLRRLARFDDEIRDAVVRFRAAGGVIENSALPGGHSDGNDNDETTAEE